MSYTMSASDINLTMNNDRSSISGYEQRSESWDYLSNSKRNPCSKRFNYKEKRELRQEPSTISVLADSENQSDCEDSDPSIDKLYPRQRERNDSNVANSHLYIFKRLIEKTGIRNVVLLHIPERSWRFFKDFVTTMIEERWRYTLLMFTTSFLSCWLLFAILWYLIAYAHGDLNVDPKTGKRLGEGDAPCVEGSTTFPGFLSFSVETQLAIGFGAKYPNNDCPEAIFLMAAQILVGVALQGAMVGIVYTKMSRPSKRRSELKFSKKAVICMRNGKLCLIFRIADTRQQHEMGTKVRAYFMDERTTAEGERMVKYHKHMEIENNGNIILVWPTTVCHIIDKSSPLYNISAEDLFRKKFEIIVTLTGSSHTMGKLMQTRSSYLPPEILWGYRFINIIRYDFENEAYVYNEEQFNTTEEVDTPLCSARYLDEAVAEARQALKDRNSERLYSNPIGCWHSMVELKNEGSSTASNYDDTYYMSGTKSDIIYNKHCNQDKYNTENTSYNEMQHRYKAKINIGENLMDYENTCV